MPFPKWRHHPEMDSRLVQDAHEESYLAPDDQGWFDNREFVRDAPDSEPVPDPIAEPAPPEVLPSDIGDLL